MQPPPGRGRARWEVLPRGRRASGGARSPDCRPRPPTPAQVPDARIRPAAGERGAGRRAARAHGWRAGHAFQEKAPPRRRAPGVGRAPAGRMGGAPTKSSGRGTRTAPRFPASGSGFDKLNLRVLEKLQEEESKECAEWLEGALSPRELRPPRARARPGPCQRAPGRRGRGGARPPRPTQLPGTPATQLPDLPPGPSPNSPAPARTAPRPGRGPRPRPR